MDGQDVKFKVANETRKFEITLFWQRSLFFAGFISIAFAGFYSTREDLFIQFIIALFSTFCSFIWYLANKGSKFWQENWEGHIEHSNVLQKEEMFTTLYRKRKRGIFGSARFSPSKLAISLSLYVCFIWVILLIATLVKLSEFYRLIGLILIVLNLIFLVLVLILTHKKSRNWLVSHGGWEVKR